jgi:regulatory protein YycI of two-component signal transduction system YycFG
LDTVDVITLTANLSFNNDTIKVQNKNGIVIGSDINELKKYIDSKVVSGTLTYIKNLNGDKDAIKLVETNVDGKLVYDINMIWSDFYNND